jgi:hypothetical protein
MEENLDPKAYDGMRYVIKIVGIEVLRHPSDELVERDVSGKLG